MKEAFILDLNFLKEQNLSVIEFITLLQLNEIDTGLQLDLDILHNLQEKQFVKLIIDKFGTTQILREKSKLLLDFLSIESSYSDYKEKKIIKKSNRVINEGFDEFIEEYRNLWKGLKLAAWVVLVLVKRRCFDGWEKTLIILKKIFLKLLRFILIR